MSLVSEPKAMQAESSSLPELQDQHCIGAAGEPFRINSTHGVGLRTTLSRLDARWLFGFFGASLLSGGLLVVRWHGLFADRAGRPSIFWCATAWARGQVLALSPVGQIGGDAYRIAASARNVGSLSECTGIVVTERVAGLFALCLVGCAGLTVMAGRPLGWLILVFGPASVVVVATRVALRRLAGSAGAWRLRIERIAAPVSGLLQRPYSIARVVSLSVAVQLITPLTYGMADRALGLTTPLWCYLVAIPVIVVAQFLPIHVAGIGLVEGGLCAMLGPWAGRTPAEIVVITNIVRVLGFCWTGLLALAFLPIPTVRREATPLLLAEDAPHELPSRSTELRLSH